MDEEKIEQLAKGLYMRLAVSGARKFGSLPGGERAARRRASAAWTFGQVPKEIYVKAVEEIIEAVKEDRCSP